MKILYVTWCWFLLVVLVYRTEAEIACLPGWTEANGDVCVVVGSARTWNEAWTFCHKHNGFIAEPGVGYTISGYLLSNLLAEYGINETWSGLHVRDGKLRLDGFNLKKPEIYPETWLWAKGEPSLDENKRCGRISLQRQPITSPRVRKRSILYADEHQFRFNKNTRVNKRDWTNQLEEDRKLNQYIREMRTHPYTSGYARQKFRRRRSVYLPSFMRRLFKRNIEQQNSRVVMMADCRERLPFICQASPTSPVVTSVSICEKGTLGNYHANRCYNLETRPTTFTEAKSKCQIQGKHLVRYSTQLEMGLANSALRPYWSSNGDVSAAKPVWVQTSYDDCSVVLSSELQISMKWPCNSSLPYLCEERGIFSAVTINLTLNGQWTRQNLFSEMFLPSMSEMPQNISLANNVTCQASPFINQLQRVTWFKDGEVVPSSLVTNLQSTATIHFARDRGIIFFPGYYWCEVVNLKTTLIVRSTKIFLRHSVMEMFAGTVRIKEKLSPKSVAVFNYAGIQNKTLQRYLQMQRETFRPFRMEPLRFRLQGQILDFLTYRRFFNVESDIAFTGSISREEEIETARRHLVNGLNGTINQPNYLDLNTLKLYDIDTCHRTVVTDEERDVTYEVRQTGLGESFRSRDICLVDNKPFVEMLCGGSRLYGAQWQQPVFNRHCDFDDVDDTTVSASLRNLSKTDITDLNVADVVKDAIQLTEDDDLLNEKDLVYSADVIQKASSLAELPSEVAEDVLDLANNVMKKDKEMLINSENLGRAASRIIKSLDTVDSTVTIPKTGALRLMTDGYGTTVWDLHKYARNPVIGLELMESNADTKLTNESLVALFNTKDLLFDGSEAAIIFPKSFMDNIIKDYKLSEIRLSMHVFKDTRLFTATENSTGKSTERSSQYVLNSKIVAAKLMVDKKKITDLKGIKVKTVFLPNKILNDDVRGNLTRCGFWDLGKDNGLGGWSVEGCYHSKVQNGRDVCLCDHLTNFAVLLDFYGQSELPEAHQLAMSIITIIGLSLSIGGLSLTVLTFILFKKLRKTRPQQTLFNLALAQLCAWIVFLAGINQTQNHAGCIAVAVLLHYFIVASFLWMLVEAVLHYMLFVKVLGSYVSHYIAKTAIPAWGIPLVPIVVVLAIDYNLYRGGDKYCWMSLIPFYYAFAIPVGLIILANVVLYLMVAVSICRKTNVSVKSTQSSTQRHLVSIRASLFCFILLGLSWIFGYLAISDARVVFQYIFTVTNTIQGFLIFLLFTARDKQVRQSWKSLCCPKKKLPTATLSTGKPADNVHLTASTGVSTSAHSLQNNNQI